MANVKINTESVKTVATRINNINGKIRDDFEDVRAAMSNLDRTWDGSAASNSMNKFNEIRVNYSTPRYNVVDNFVRFLLKQVGEGYEQTEEANKSLADAFK